MAYGLITYADDTFQKFKYLTSDDIVAKLNPEHSLHRAHIQAIRDLVRTGCKYSNEDTDVLGAALATARTARIKIEPWEAKWVEVMNKKYQA